MSQLVNLLTCCGPAAGGGGGLLDNEVFAKRFPCFCGTHVFGLTTYAVFLATAGVFTMTLQIHRILQDGDVLSNKFLPMVDPQPSPLDEVTTRDMKLVLSILELAVHSCLLLGSVIRYNMLLLPWILEKLFLMSVTALITSWKFFLQRPMTLSTLGFMSFLIEMHNFLYVLCLLDEIVRK